MIVDKANNFAFLHINKTGGNSIKKVLMDIAGIESKFITDHRTISLEFKRARMTYPGVDLRKLNIYANIRNPFGRIVSIYAYRLQKKMGQALGKTFKEWFYDRYGKGVIVNGSIGRYLTIDGKKPDNITVVKLEEADKMWEKIIWKHFKVKVYTLPRENTSKHKDPMGYYDRKMIDKVKEVDNWVIENYYPELGDI